MKSLLQINGAIYCLGLLKSKYVLRGVHLLFNTFTICHHWPLIKVQVWARNLPEAKTATAKRIMYRNIKIVLGKIGAA
jgi:hypothetical protein